jgi:hypothetical protein
MIPSLKLIPQSLVGTHDLGIKSRTFDARTDLNVSFDLLSLFILCMFYACGGGIQTWTRIRLTRMGSNYAPGRMALGGLALIS